MSVIPAKAGIYTIQNNFNRCHSCRSLPQGEFGAGMTTMRNTAFQGADLSDDGLTSFLLEY